MFWLTENRLYLVGDASHEAGGDDAAVELLLRGGGGAVAGGGGGVRVPAEQLLQAAPREEHRLDEAAAGLEGAAREQDRVLNRPERFLVTVQWET